MLRGQWRSAQDVTVRKERIRFAYDAALEEVKERPQIVRDRQSVQSPAVSSISNQEKGRNDDKVDKMEGDKETLESETPGMWNLLNTLTFGALDKVAPLADGFVEGFAAGGIGQKTTIGDSGSSDPEAGAICQPEYEADDEREVPAST